jgi:hypothetical protein
MAQWTDEAKAALKKAYLDREPTPANSVEIVKELADEMNESPNAIRMVLQKMDVYVKKDAAATSSTTKAATGDKPVRVSKEAAHQRLNAAIQAAGQEPDSEIVSKLTGKAALHFADIIEAITKN